MSIQPKVSIIIPVWNAEAYLRRCLDSICGQTLRDIEIICVNDASTDGSLAILHEYMNKDARIRVISLDKNFGESVARNVALNMATGEYIGSVDNDDIIDIDFYDTLYTKAKSSAADIVKGNLIWIDYNCTRKIININNMIRKNKVDFSWQWWTAIYKTQLIKMHNIHFPEKCILGGDLVFLLYTVLFSNTIETNDEVFYHYIRREDSGDSKILSIDKIFSLFSAFEMMLDAINKYKYTLDNDQYDYLYYTYIMLYRNTLFHSIDFYNQEASIKKYAAKKIIEYYNDCPHRPALDEKLYNKNPGFHMYISSCDVENMTRYLLKYNTLEKCTTHDLRTRIAQRMAACPQAQAR